MRLKDGTWAGHVMEHVALELQTLSGLDTGFGKARETSTRGVYKVIIYAVQEKVGEQSLLLAKELVMAAINDTPFDLQAHLNDLKDTVDEYCLGPSTGCIVEAANDRKIPSIRLTEGNLVQLGYGAKQRRIWTAETDRTSAISENISSDKDLTKQLLKNCGIPVPQGQLVNNAEDAWTASQEIGLPVVVKPSDANRGRGVSLGLKTEANIKAAFEIANRYGTEVLVERYVQGDEHRLLVVGDKVVAATKGETAGVSIIVQRNGNMNNDVTDVIHPEVAAIVCLAARVVGLDIAGIDLVAQDISKPLNEQDAAIVEVNAGPGLLMHLKPLNGQARPVGRSIVDHLFTNNENGRIPIVGILGSVQTNLLSHLVAWFLHLSGKRVGLACEEGLYMDQRKVESTDARDFTIGERLLINRTLEAAVFQTSPWHICQDGLPYDRCLVGVVTDMKREDWDLREHDISSDEKFKSVMRTQIDLVLTNGVSVLNAEDTSVVDLAQYSDGEVIFYSTDPDIEVMKVHRAEGKRNVYYRDGHVVLARGGQETLLFHLDFPPIAMRIKQDGFNLSTLLAGVACGWALDIAPLLIRAGLKNFGQKNSISPPLDIRTYAS